MPVVMTEGHVDVLVALLVVEVDWVVCAELVDDDAALELVLLDTAFAEDVEDEDE